MKAASLGATELAYEVTGDRGSPVLLIIGLGAPGNAWRHEVPLLARHHRVATYDHRGVGLTRARTPAFSTETLARDARGLLDRLGWDQAHVVGVSLGGMVAQALAIAAPSRVRSLTLIATHGGGLGAGLPTPVGLALFAAANLGPRRFRLLALEHLLFPAEFLASCDRAWLRQVLGADFGHRVAPRFRMGQVCAALRHHPGPRDLARLGRVPTLIVKPGRDLLVRPGQSDRLHRRIPGSRLVVLKDAGHGLIRQVPEALCALLLSHFDAADGPR